MLAIGGMIVGRAWREAVYVCALALALLIVEGGEAAWPALEPIDSRRLERFGLRLIDSDHAELITDLPSAKAIDELPTVIDRAVPLWAERFDLRASQVAEWRLRLCLIGEESRFAAAGLMPEGDRRFPNGLALGYAAWVREQPSDHYRRHLVLHEATHSFMQTQLGGCGPGWHMEGVAELCGTHVWRDNLLRIAVIPPSKQAAPMWGRVRAVRDAVAEGRGRSIAAVRELDNQRPMSPEEYSWVWALAKLLDTHPRYTARFRGLSAHVNDSDFDTRFDEVYADDREQLEQEWRLFGGTLEYGHDIEREAIDFREGDPLDASASVTIRADRGWQSSGMRVDAGGRYRIEAEGRYVIARETDGAPWPCEPGGVTLDYHRGRPLGELLAAVDSGPDAFLRATPIGLGADFRSERSGTLYFRVNDRPDRLRENSGSVSVVIRTD